MNHFQITRHIPDDMRVLLDCSHTSGLVLLSILVASAAGYVTLVMADRVGDGGRTGRELWRWVGAACLGGGIWSMHFIAMLAFQVPVALHYHTGLTVTSLVVAVLASYLVIHALGRRRLHKRQYGMASVSAGLGIAAMHYLGMAAIRSEAVQYYDPLQFTLSIVIAVAVSLAALVLGGFFRGRIGARYGWLRLLASLVMGGAIVSMHFTGMAALTLAVPADAVLQAPGGDTVPSLLAGGIGLLTLMLIVTGIGASWAEQRLRTHQHDLRAVVNQLDAAIHYDPTTNLLNRPALQRLATNLLPSEDPLAAPHGLFFVNLDNFKRINNSLGHQAGDETLRITAQRLRNALGQTDILARFAGDEFCVLAEGLDADAAERLALRLQAQLNAPFNIQGSQIRLTASIGYCIYPDDGTRIEELLNGASLALGYCKRSGRNRNLRYMPALKEQADAELLIEQQLRQAIADDSLELHYQPVVDCNSGEVVSLEALLRWRDAGGNPISPEIFVAVAEHHGFSAELDGWVLNRACADIKQFRLLGHKRLRVAVNCSANTLADPDMASAVAVQLDRHGIQGGALCLEITENALMENVTTATLVLQELRDLGVAVSIDDFGTGYSSLNYLRRLPVDTLKVDRSFIRDIPQQSDDCEITAGIIALAHKLRLKVVAEGVETHEQLTFLRRNDCDFVQGYFYSVPLPFDALQRWLSRETPSPPTPQPFPLQHR